MSPSDWELLVELLGGFGLLLVGLGVGLFILWILLPFAVFGIKGLLTEMVSELSEMNDHLSELNDRAAGIPRAVQPLPTEENQEPDETPDIPATFMGLKLSELGKTPEPTKTSIGFMGLRLPDWYKRAVGRAPFND